MLPAKNGENLPCGFLVVKKCKIVSGWWKTQDNRHRPIAITLNVSYLWSSKNINNYDISIIKTKIHIYCENLYHILYTGI